MRSFLFGLRIRCLIVGTIPSINNTAIGTAEKNFPAILIASLTPNYFFMPNAFSLAAISQGQLVKIVDSERAAGDLFQLPVAFRSEFDTTLAALELADSNTALTESNRAGGSVAARVALVQLETLVRDGYNGIKAIRSSLITDAQKLEVYTAYGWSGGKLGLFNDARVLGLARLALSADLDIEKPEWEYTADLKTEIAEQLAAFDAVADDRTGGERMGATRTRDEALAAFQTMLSRTRFYLCFASDDTDQSPELRRYGFKVRKDRASSKANPPAPGGATPTP